jgi:N,N'-diacetyllegionaminate synthase
VRTLIIAEAGVNHNGDLSIARTLIDAAADAGADLVKFQTFRADRLVTASAGKAPYQQRSPGDAETQQQMLSRLELTREMHEALIERCHARGIGFFSTAFDIESLDLLISLGLDRFKVPSGEITNLPYLRHVARQGKPVLLSTGMATMDEIAAALDALARGGTPRSRVTVLHCSSEYPVPIADVNLRAMQTLATTFAVAVGYSDHTVGLEVATAAVALGAVVIEKHFTLDRGMDGPDHRASLEPDELTALVSAIRNVEQALGDGAKRLTRGEARNRPVARKSLVASAPIRAGDRFSPANITAKRPGTGISPMRWDEVIGRIAVRDFAVDEAIEL